VTSILVTHDQTEATAMADRIAVMNHGELQQVGTPQDLYERPANLFVANFIGEPRMNLLTAQLTDGKLVGRGWSAALDKRRGIQLAQHNGAVVTAGIRPEHIILGPATDDGGGNGVVVYREPRGDADVLTIRLDGVDGTADSVVAEIVGPSIWRAGDAVRLQIDAGRVLVFDTGNGRNLAAAA